VAGLLELAKAFLKKKGIFPLKGALIGEEMLA